MASLILRTLPDRPIAGITSRAKLNVGITGLITPVMEIVLWLLPSVMEHNPYAAIPLPQTAATDLE